MRISDDLVVAKEDPRDLIHAVFPHWNAFGPKGDHEARLAVSRGSMLAPRNDDKRSLNEEIMPRVPAEDVKSLSVDGTADMDRSGMYPAAFLQTLTPAGIPTHRVFLKVRVPFMLLRTINVAKRDKPTDATVQRRSPPPHRHFAVGASRRSRDWATRTPEGLRSSM